MSSDRQAVGAPNCCGRAECKAADVVPRGSPDKCSGDFQHLARRATEPNWTADRRESLCKMTRHRRRQPRDSPRLREQSTLTSSWRPSVWLHRTNFSKRSLARELCHRTWSLFMPNCSITCAGALSAFSSSEKSRCYSEPCLLTRGRFSPQCTQPTRRHSGISSSSECAAGRESSQVETTLMACGGRSRSPIRRASTLHGMKSKESISRVRRPQGVEREPSSCRKNSMIEAIP